MNNAHPLIQKLQFVPRSSNIQDYRSFKKPSPCKSDLPVSYRVVTFIERASLGIGGPLPCLRDVEILVVYLKFRVQDCWAHSIRLEKPVFTLGDGPTP